MKLKKRYTHLRLILGDQLNRQHSWFSETDDSVLYLIAELKQETGYVTHHLQKLCAFFLAMKHMADDLLAQGHQVLHLDLDQTSKLGNLNDLLGTVIEKYDVEFLQYQQPDEFRLREQLRSLRFVKTVSLQECESEHFYLRDEELPNYLRGHQHNRMETFYRKMRVRFNILLEDGKPLGGKWNYDSENRSKLKAQDLLQLPQPLVFRNEVRDCLERIEKHEVKSIGEVGDEILWPVNREQALSLLSYFCEYCLPFFGQFQDAMTCQHPDQWSLYHSRLSFALNAKILSPHEVIAAAIARFENAGDEITLPQIEGFVRQILGWREYVRGVYWLNMPDYSEQNALAADRDLPDFFWHGQTKMKCMQAAIGQSLEFAYAHHIQRLMVTGNFCLLAGVEPKQVDEWYLGIYIDAIEWVELPNTRGMSQFADGGWIATKPYAASGNYINKMSDYCKHCDYKLKEKSSEDACPMNSLYWSFMLKHRAKLERNPRIGMVYRSWDKQTQDNKEAIIARADWCLTHINEL